jgi:hypothetical protein
MPTYHPNQERVELVRVGEKIDKNRQRGQYTTFRTSAISPNTTRSAWLAMHGSQDAGEIAEKRTHQLANRIKERAPGL